MTCDSCGKQRPGGPDTCRQCRVRVDATRDGTAGSPPIVPDGGQQPPDDGGDDPLAEPSDGEGDDPLAEPSDGGGDDDYLEPGEIVDADAGESDSGEHDRAAGEPQPAQAAGEPQPAQDGQPAGGPPVEPSDGGTIVDEIQEFPLKLGAALGAIAFLLPYGLLTLATYFGYEKPPGEGYQPLPDVQGWQFVEGSQTWGELAVSAELFFSVVELGSGETIVDLYRRAADLGRPADVDPADYPTVEDELGPLLGDLLALDAFPDVPLLILFALAPYVLFVSSRYLARNHAPGDTVFEYAVAGATVTIGTLVVALLVGLVFPVTDLAGRLLFAGILVPGVVGAVGGLTIWGFDDHSALVSTLTAWATIAVGVAVGFLLLPLPELDVELGLGLLERLVLALGAYLNAAQFDAGTHAQGRLFFLLVAALTVGAGFVRTWQIREEVSDRMDGARVGASIFLGFVTTFALLLWVLPMSTVLVDLGLASSGDSLVLELVPEVIEGGSLGGVPVTTIRTVTSVESYVHAILVGGVVFPMTFGGIGGYLAVWQRDR